MPFKRPCHNCKGIKYRKRIWLKMLGPDKVFCSDDCLFRWCVSHNVRDEEGLPLTAIIDTKTGKRIESPYWRP